MLYPYDINHHEMKVVFV